MKQQRTFIVLAVAVLTAGLASYGVYLAIQRMPVREVEVDSVPVVVASKTIPVGTRLTSADLRVARWPARNQVPGAFADPKVVIDRGVIETISENQPLTTRNVASVEAGAGLPPVIPAGMRAVSVRVNEVIGVAGFVLPGTRVDVVATVDDADGTGTKNEPMSRTVISNVLVLTAGTRYDQEEAKNGKPQRSTVVTLAVLPADGERIALASSKGEISLALRNPVDVESTQTPGIRLAALMRGMGPEPVVDQQTRRVRPARPSAPPPPVVMPTIYRVETIRAAKRAEEVVR
jgi:pilus assembly protein CpaB